MAVAPARGNRAIATVFSAAYTMTDHGRAGAKTPATRFSGTTGVARIAISLCGEGRGHATRVATLVERLPSGHTIRIYTSADAHDMLARRFPGDGPVSVSEIPGIVFQYTDGRLDIARSITVGLDYQARILGPLVERLATELQSFGADLAVTDFEPALPRACARLGIPLVSVDHQHFLLAYSLGILPWGLQWHAWFMSHAVWMYSTDADDTVVSAFFRPALKPGWEHVVQVGPLLRPALLAVAPEDRGHVVSYLRRTTPDSVLDALDEAGLPIRVYGLGARPSWGHLTFHEIDERRFIDDLAGCRALISAAGNQLIGEALHFGKPMFLLPERAHAEQLINSHFLADMAAGSFCPLEAVSPEVVRGFVAGLEPFEAAAQGYRGRMDGTPTVIDVITARLAAGRTPRGAGA
ncbi:MAG: teichoic acid biosynthesis protein [Planctomycetes bacterium]|nr:teichoic acid biosynthesis protein [Planctomycetota bacterium]